MGSPEGSYDKLLNWLIGLSLAAVTVLVLAALVLVTIRLIAKRNTADLIFTPQELSDRARVFGVVRSPEGSRLDDAATLVQPAVVITAEVLSIEPAPAKPARDPDSVRWITKFDAELAELNAQFDQLAAPNPDRGWDGDAWWDQQLRAGGAFEARYADWSTRVMLGAVQQLAEHQAQAMISWLRSDWDTNQYPLVPVTRLVALQ